MIHFQSMRSSRFVPFTVLLALVGFGAAGCATSEYRYSKVVAGGERLTFRMVKGRMDDMKVDEFEGRSPVVLPDKGQKKISYAFGIHVDSPTPPKHVRVEDVSDEQPILLLEDASPQLNKQYWRAQSAWYGVDAPEINWVTFLGESVRVYRFTITAADGRTVVLHQGMVVPAFQKVMMRHLLGKDY
jgi:hypothetical protein